MEVPPISDESIARLADLTLESLRFPGGQLENRARGITAAFVSERDLPTSLLPRPATDSPDRDGLASKRRPSLQEAVVAISKGSRGLGADLYFKRDEQGSQTFLLRTFLDTARNELESFLLSGAVGDRVAAPVRLKRAVFGSEPGIIRIEMRSLQIEEPSIPFRVALATKAGQALTHRLSWDRPETAAYITLSWQTADDGRGMELRWDEILSWELPGIGASSGADYPQLGVGVNADL